MATYLFYNVEPVLGCVVLKYYKKCIYLKPSSNLKIKIAVEIIVLTTWNGFYYFIISN